MTHIITSCARTEAALAGAHTPSLTRKLVVGGYFAGVVHGERAVEAGRAEVQRVRRPVERVDARRVHRPVRRHHRLHRHTYTIAVQYKKGSLCAKGFKSEAMMSAQIWDDFPRFEFSAKSNGEIVKTLTENTRKELFGRSPVRWDIHIWIISISGRRLG